MKKLFNFLRKPLVWRTFVVLLVIGFNILFESGVASTAFWTIFATMGVLCLGGPQIPRSTMDPGKMRRDTEKRNKCIYGAPNIDNYPLRKKILGY